MKTFSGRKLGRPSGPRIALLKGLAGSLLLNETIRTTFPKAREVSRYADKLISHAKEEGLSGRRKAAKVLTNPSTMKKLFDVLVPRYSSRNGGYTQVLRVGPRQGDMAPMAVVRLLP